MNPENLVGVSEIASLAKVSKQAVSNWRRRYEDFPAPIQTLESGSVWNKESVVKWLNSYRDEATHVLSFINLKGGVGKTTTAIGVAEILAKEHGKRVLVIDLDPQTNASIALISDEKWKEMDAEGRTIAQLFADKLNPDAPPRFDIERAITHQVSTIGGGIAKLDLLPSSIKLILIQDRIHLVGMLNDLRERPIDILRNAIEPILKAYAYVIIDCPPSLGVVTRNGLRISTGYVIPTIPDILSTWGLYQIVDSVKQLSGSENITINPLGIIATKVQANNLHRRVMDDLRNRRLGNFGSEIEHPPLFKAKLTQCADIARSADIEADKRTFHGKYGKGYPELQEITQEIIDLCEKRNSSSES